MRTRIRLRRLKAARKARKMTQEQLEAASGVDRSHISYLESAKAGFSVESWVRLADALGVTPEYLLGYDFPPAEDMNPPLAEGVQILMDLDDAALDVAVEQLRALKKMQTKQ